MSEQTNLLDLIDQLRIFETGGAYPKGFNIFEVIGMERQEIKHSNFLAFLLDPNSDHPFGDRLIRSLLREAAQRSNIVDFSPLSMEIKDYHDLIVRREWSNQTSRRKLDLVMKSDSNQEVYVIEVKIGASESENQLSEYKRIIDSHDEYKNYTKRYIFLTPDSKLPSDDIWSTLDYNFIADKVAQILLLYKGHIDLGLEKIIGDYVRLLRRHVVEDEILKEECRAIYSRHKKALDLIFKYGAVQKGAFADAANVFFGETSSELVVLGGVRPREAAFLPRNLADIVPDLTEINWHGQSKPVLIWFQDLGDRIKIIFEVGPMADKDARGQLVEGLRSILGYRGTKKIKDSFTRCWSKTAKMGDDEQQDHELTLEKMQVLWNELNIILNKHYDDLRIMLSKIAQSPS